MVINLLEKKGVLITSYDGLEIEANEFEYDKLKNILNAYGEMLKFNDKKNNYYSILK